MKLELKPEALEVVKKRGPDSTNAGVTQDGQISWAYQEGLLEVFLAHTSELLSSWRFGKALKDFHTSISCVTDLKYRGGHLLLVATSNLSDQGMLNLYSIGLRKVIRAIEFPQRITAVEAIFANVNEDVPNWVISKHLQFFSGLAAVGTEGGHIYLVDLCLDELRINHTTEAVPKKLAITNAHIVDPKAKRDQARLYDKHVALMLDDQCHRQGHFYFRRQDDTVQKVLDEDSVCVTSLKYTSQAGILAVGFNFGSFQLWRLYNPVLDYSSRYNPEGTSISGFVVQEPENDPRNFVYLWVAQDDKVEDSLSNICLYQLSFTRKDTYAKFGVFYDELESVCARLDHRMTLDPYGGDPKSTWSSSIISCYTITNPYYTPPSTLSDSFEEGLHGNDLSLSVFVWRAKGKQGVDSVKHWMCIFDLNRWYHAQMPHALRCHGGSLQVCSYWAVYNLDDIVSLTTSHSLVNVEIIGDKVLRFINNSPLPPEEHSFPSSLQLTSVRFLLADGTVRGRCDGWQGHLLQELMTDGAQILVEPADFYHQCFRARLLPQNYEEMKTSSQSYQRIMLLNMALERGVISTLVAQCIQLWSDGEYAEQGCTLTLLLDWAWDRVVNIKHCWDTACEMLYDWSGHHLDPRTDWQLETLTESLFHLKQVFSALAAQSSPTTERGQLELELRQDVVNILQQNYGMVRWCVSFNLLPEIDEASDPLPGLFAYPISDLCEAYKKRRAELSGLKSPVDGFSLLLIDELLECQGPHIKKLWETLGGDGLYPPPSIQALVNMYLLDEVSLEIKHAITLYLLQDLAALAKADAEETIVASFIQRFLLTPSVVHQVQGLWFIDHRDFEEGVRQMVNPNILDDLGGNWKHAAVVNTLVAQSQGKAASRYLHTKGVLGGSPQEQQLYISVLMHNRHVSQAMEFMRGCQKDSNSAQLVTHLLKECQKYKLLGQLLQMSLTDAEERYLEEYLRQRPEPHALEPLLLYYLHHSRFLQAFQLNEDMKRLDKLETSLAAQERVANRNRLVDAYLKALPDVTRKLLMEKKRGPTTAAKHVQVQRPKPLSTVVHNSDYMAMSRSHFVMTVIEKVTEAQQMVKDEEGGDVEKTSDLSVQKLSQTNNVPFLSTPRTPKHKSRSRYTEVIYSELKVSPKPTNLLSATKRKSLLGSTYGQQNGNVSLRQLTEECLQLLHTPVRNHKRKSFSPGLSVKTPQSILKVRRLSKTILPGSRDKSSSRRRSGSHSRRPGISKSDSLLLTSPSSPPVTENLTSSSAQTKKDTAVTATPKQLRFVGISPSPTPSPTAVSAEFLRSPSTEVSEEIAEGREPMVTSPPQVTQPAQTLNKDGILSRQETVVLSAADATKTSAEVSMEESSSLPGTSVPAHLKETLHVDTELSTLVSESGKYRLSDKLKELVRPDLESPWKHGQISAGAESDVPVTEVVVDDDITFNLTHVEAEPAPLTPSMTSSPVSDPVAVGVAMARVDEDMKEAEQVGGSDSRLANVHSAHKQIVQQVYSASSSETHTVTFNQETKKTVTKHIEQSVNTESSVSHLKDGSPMLRKSPRKSLSPFAEPLLPLSKSKQAITVAEERIDLRSRREESPPATPPSSKKAKMMFSGPEDEELIRKSQHSIPSPKKSESEDTRRRKTPERRSPSRKSEREQLQRRTPDRKSPSRTLKKEDDIVVDTSMKETVESSPPWSRRKTPERSSVAKEYLKVPEPPSNSEMEIDEEKPQVVPSSPSRRSRKSPSRAKIEERNSGEEKFTAVEEVIKQLSEAEKSPDMPIRRRSARLNTPDRTLGDTATLEPLSPARGQGGRGKTPQRTAQKEDTEQIKKTPQKAAPKEDTEQVKKTLQKAVPKEDTEQIKKTPQKAAPKEDTEQIKKTPQKAAPKEDTEQVKKTPQKAAPTEDTEQVKKTPQKAAPTEDTEQVKKTAETNRKPEESRKERKSSGPGTPRRSTRSTSESKSKSPERESSEKDEKEEKESNVLSVRRSRRASKTPERLVAANSTEVVTPTRKSRRQHRSPEKLNTLEIEPVPVQTVSSSPKQSPQPKARMKEPNTPVKKSDQLKSQETPLTPTRRSTRKPKILERLNTDEIEPVSPSSSPSRSPTGKNRSKFEDSGHAGQVTEKKSVPPSPSRRTRRGDAEESKTPTHNLRSRKTPDRNVQDAGKDVVEKSQIEETSPERKVSAKSPGRSRKSPSRETKSPSRKNRKTSEQSDEVEMKSNKIEEYADEFEEELPPLRLEMDDEEDQEGNKDADFTKTKQVQRQRTASDRGHRAADEGMASEDPLPPAAISAAAKSSRKTTRKEDVGAELSPSFIFSPPLRHTQRRRREEMEEEGMETQSLVFVFSNPTVAVGDDEGAGEDVTVKRAKTETQNKAAETKKNRKKRTLYNESPILLSPLPVATRRSRKQPTESQRASASIVKRYKPRAPRTRRIKPL